MGANDLAARHCTACHGGTPALAPGQAADMLRQVPAWRLTADGKRVRREWRTKDFLTAVAFFDRVAALAEAEQHHPDLHLTGYREAAVEIWTHAVGGLTENDFILAAKIDALEQPAPHKPRSS